MIFGESFLFDFIWLPAINQAVVETVVADVVGEESKTQN